MPNLMKSGRLVLTATLAASTVLGSLPTAFAAGDGAFRIAQADPGESLPPPRQGGKRPPAEGEGGEPGQGRPRGAEPEGAQRAEPPRPRAAEPEAAPRAEQPRPPKREAQPEPAATEQPPQRETPPPRKAEPAPEAPKPQRNRAEPAEGAERPAERAPVRATPAPEPAASEEVPPPAPRKAQPKPADARPAEKPAPAAEEPNSGRRQPEGKEPAAPAPNAAEAPADAIAPSPEPKRNSAEQPAEAPKGSRRAPAEPAAPNARAQEEPAGQARVNAPTAAPAAPVEPGAPRQAAPTPAEPAQVPEAPSPRDQLRAAPAAEPNGAAPAPAAPTNVAPAVPGATPAPAPSTAAPAAPGDQGAATLQPPPPAQLRPQPVPADIQNAPVQPGRLNQSDARVQTLQQPIAVSPITQETGERVREEPRYVLPPDAKVVKSDGDRQILSLGAAAIAGAVAGAAAGYFIRSNDDDRLAVDASDTYSERLPGGRTRETVVRPNGVEVVTITNRYGDVIRRSRIMPDGREIVLFYDPYGADAQRPDYYEDPGRELPPLRLDIPEDRYVVDVDQPDERLYYDTLVAPPVETVERIYSIDEVRRSERIRDKVRRIDLATINFDFASAAISQDQARKLQDLAEAIKRIVQTDPGETFLIEGHTDAVGSPEANLILSDKRAEAVASALTEYFEVPAENLVTQGYGEQELKVNTQAENRENRRVTVRRITALVKPVATSSR